MNGNGSLPQRLAEIYEASYAATREGPNSSAFIAWHTEARDTLIAALGAHDSLVVEFDNLKFDIADDVVLQSFRERLRKIRIITVEQNANVTRIQSPPSPESIQQQRFTSVMALAREILLTAKVQLQVNRNLSG